MLIEGLERLMFQIFILFHREVLPPQWGEVVYYCGKGIVIGRIFDLVTVSV